MVQAALGNIGLVLLVPPRGSTALNLIGLWHVEARGGWLLQRTLLGEVPRLATSIAATSLTTSVGICRVVVTTWIVPTSSTVGVQLTVGVVGPRGLRCKPLRGWRRPGWGQTVTTQKL
jgi:hypothetical protein